MSAGRRGFVLSVAFLAAALWLCAGPSARAQFGRPADGGAGKHTIWQSELTPEQIREVLSRFGQDNGKNDWFEQMLFDAVKQKNPGANDAQVKEAIKKLISNKEFMDRATDLAQKQKNLQKNPNNDPNAPLPKLTPEDIAKLAKLRPEGKNADPFKLPEDGNKFPVWDPRNPQFDPKRFPAIDPDEPPPKADPKTKLPLDPQGRPFDPRDGNPVDPRNPPKFDPPAPKLQPGNDVPPPPNPRPNPNDPPQGRPDDPNRPNRQPPPGKDVNAPPPNNPDNRRFDPENPLGNPNDSPDKIAKTKAVETATALWEKNVGPIDESPAVKRAIIDLVADEEAMNALTDANGNNLFDMLRDGGADGDKLGDLFGKGGDSNWEWPKFDWNWGKGRNLDLDFGNAPSRPRPDLTPRSSPRWNWGGGWGGGPSFNFGGMSVPWLFVVILLLAIVAAVVWWKWADLVLARQAAAFAGGPGPWPIDPRNINSREDVVKAFEYLSVLICGPAAKTWTHSTIAEELIALAATHGETAVKLARLYELARYAPLDEPLTRAELLEARRLACDLAGIDE
jgi:hypothetical protein